MVLPKNLVEHHCDCKIMGIAQCVSSPAVVNTTAFS